MSDDDADVILYRLQACPFCERVVCQLEEHDVDYTSRFVRPMHSDRDIVKRVSGNRLVPVLVENDTEEVLTESANIVKHIQSKYGDDIDINHGS